MNNFVFSEIEYIRPDFDNMAKVWADATVKIETADDFETIKSVIEVVENEYRHVYTMMTIASIRNTLDTTDEFYESENEYNETKFPTIANESISYYKALIASNFASEINDYYGTEFLISMQREVDSFDPVMVPYMQKESILCNKYQKIMATAKIPFMGKEYNLYGIMKFFEDPDRTIRANAYKAYSDFYASNEDELEVIFDELVKLRTKMGKALGYETYTPLGYKLQGRSDYGQDEVAAFRKQVLEEIVPLCEKIYQSQAKRIGVKDFKAYDETLIFSDGNAVPIGDDDFMIEEARKMYHDLSPETAEFIDFMIEHELMDLKNTPNKASTGYMTELLDYDAPFVFSCFNQTIDDMGVLAHELGHAFNGYRAMRHQPVARFTMSSTDIAEIHSMAMEQFTYSYAEQFFGADADKYRFAHLQNAVTFVPFGVAVDEFQHIIYENPELTPKERTYEWHKLEEKYMPWRKYDNDPFFERGGYWYHKLHIFIYPFYYINYTLTTMGAMEFKKKFEENREKAWSDYLNLCDAGGSLNYLSLLKVAGLSVPFEEGSVKNAMSYVKEIILKNIGEK